MFCSKCGKQAEGDFCWSCGAKLYKPQSEEQKDTELTQETVKSIPASPIQKKRPVSFMKFKSTRAFSNVQFDDVHQIVAVGAPQSIIDHSSDAIFFRYSEIIDADLVENDSTVTKANTASMLTRAAVGSMISTGAAIVGGATAKRNETPYIDKLYIRVLTSNTKNPTIIIDFISVKTQRSLCNATVSEAENILGVLKQAQVAQPRDEAFEVSEIWGKPAVQTSSRSNSSGPFQEKEMWICAKCGFRNNSANKTCANCYEAKSYLSGTSRLSAVAEESSASDSWLCEECDYKNNGGKSCKSCGAARPLEEPKRKKGLFGIIKK